MPHSICQLILLVSQFSVIYLDSSLICSSSAVLQFGTSLNWKKKKSDERASRAIVHHSARFACCLFFSVSARFLPFSPTAERGPRLRLRFLK